MFPNAHLEDFTPGDVFEYGAYEATEADIVEFGRKFDPQTFHTDPEGAKQTSYGGLIAAGLHTASMFMAMLIEAFPKIVSHGSPGWDEVRWTAPVRPGDMLKVRSEVVSARPSKSRPDRGIVSMTHAISNDKGETVFTVTNYWFVGKRDAA